MPFVSMNYDELSSIQEAVSKTSENAEKVIDEVLHKEGAEYIQQNIHKLLPYSGRKWKGKKAPAASTQPFRQDNGLLSVTIRTKTNYNYLYFPDDGSNTRHHAGNQQFMLHGAEQSSDQIVQTIQNKIINLMEGK